MKMEQIQTKNKIGELRFIFAGTKVWSICNQCTISFDEDKIIKIKHTGYPSNIIFVEPMQLLFNLPGHIPTLIGRGTDEWSLNYSDTLPYTIPEPNF